jgi:hypothetical protein
MNINMIKELNKTYSFNWIELNFLAKPGIAAEYDLPFV